MALKNSTALLTTSLATIYSCAAGIQASAHGIVFTNISSADANITLTYYQASTATTYTLADGYVITAEKTDSWPKPLNMAAGDYLQAKASTGSAISIVVSIYEDTSSVAIGFTPVGTWSSTSTYSKNDVVSYNGSSYAASQSHSNQTPDTSPSYWTLISQKGIDGAGFTSGTQNGVVYAATSSTFGTTGVGTAGQALVSTGSGAPAFTSLTLENLPDAWIKRAVKCATTANITLSGTQTIDGIAVVAGDRVLVKGQSTPSQNGIYVVSTTAWSRATDANTSSYIAGAQVSVDQGTVNGGAVFDTDFKSTDTLGTTNMTWYRVVDTNYLSTWAGNKLYYRKNTATTLSSNNTAQSWLGLTNGVTVAASTVYRYRGFFNLTTTGTTSHTEALLFGGTATLTNITSHFLRTTNSTTATSPFSAKATAATATVITGALTTAQDVNYYVEGTIAVNAAGTISPQIQFSAAPGGTSTVVLGAYFELEPIGASGSNSTNGTWA